MTDTKLRVGDIVYGRTDRLFAHPLRIERITKQRFYESGHTLTCTDLDAGTTRIMGSSGVQRAE